MRITDINIKNYRAFYGEHEICLDKDGKNLMLYGENGSGKSSLFKALNNYLTSSRDNTFQFVKNHYRPTGDNGQMRITFSDAGPVTFLPITGTEQPLNFGTAASTNNVNYVMDAELISNISPAILGMFK